MMTQDRGFKLSLLVLLIVAGFCVFWFKQSSIKARVNGHKITVSEIRKRALVVQIYFPVASKQAEKIAFSQWLNTIISAEVLKNNAWPLDEVDLVQASLKMENSAQLANKLPEIKLLFKDRGDYLKYFVLPIYVQDSLPEVYRQKTGALPLGETDLAYISWIKQENAKVQFITY